MTEWAGMDSTKEFDRAGHSGDAKKDLKKFKIGEVVEVGNLKFAFTFPSVEVSFLSYLQFPYKKHNIFNIVFHHSKFNWIIIFSFT